MSFRWLVPVAVVALIAIAVVLPLIEDPDLVGTYVLESSPSPIVLTLEEDGIATVQASGSADLTGSWELKDDQVIITVPSDNEQTFEIRGERLVDPNGGTWVRTDEDALPEVPDAASTANPALDAIDSALKNAATAMESYAVETEGDYSKAGLTELEEQGLRLPVDIALTIDSRRASYCIEAEHSGLPGVVKHYNSNVGSPEDGPC
jgi:hypothetical protein